MILGMSIATFTLFHVIISFLGIATGLIIVIGMMKSQTMPKWTAGFLATTVATSVTGFMFPFVAIGPPHIIGAISLVALTIAILALYKFDLRGRWRGAYITTAVLSLYLNVFVAIVQAFLKIEAVHVLAPTQTEPPFLIAQTAVLLLFAAVC